MSGPRTRILFIGGCGRSGTTLLGQILGQAEGFCFVGEAMYGWRSLSTRRCGCGVRASECDFWRAVRRQAGAGRLLEEPEFFGLGRLARWRHLALTFTPDCERRLATLYGEHWQGCERLYAAIAAVSGAEVIVDSSKAVPYGRMLSLMPGLDLRVVHVVRDARAVVYSWKRLKPAPDRFENPYMTQQERGPGVLFWIMSNLGAELFLPGLPDRYLRLRYENLVARPHESVGRILRMATERPVDVPFADARTVGVGPTHSIAGNADRLRTGPVELRCDDEWKTGMSRADRRFVTALTWPLLLRYGYLGRAAV